MYIDQHYNAKFNRKINKYDPIFYLSKNVKIINQFK